MTTEDKVRNLEINQAVLDSKLKQHFSTEDEFQKTVLEKLEYFQHRDIKVFQFIETHMEKEKAQAAKDNANAELKRAIIEKLVTSGIWGSLLLVGSILWYAFNQFIHKGS
jgi:hypothetical protein